MPEITASLSERAYRGLERLARREGLTPEEALAKYLEHQLARKTKPNTTRGTVQPFRRKD